MTQRHIELKRRRELDNQFREHGGVIAYAKKLRAERYTYQEIGELIGVSQKSAYNYCNSESKSVPEEVTHVQ